MDYLIRFIQTHDTFRKPETEALATLNGIKLEWLFYSEDVCHVLEIQCEGQEKE